MPRLAKEYKDAGNKKVPFDLEKVRALGRDCKGKDKRGIQCPGLGSNRLPG